MPVFFRKQNEQARPAADRPVSPLAVPAAAARPERTKDDNGGAANADPDEVPADQSAVAAALARSDVGNQAIRLRALAVSV